VRQFYLETDPDHLPRPGDTVTLDQAESHHLFTVLRGGRDPQLDLVDGCGHRLTGLPLGKEGKRAQVKILTCDTDAAEFLEPRLVLACAVVKGRRFEWALEKAVELGAHEILPLVTDLGVIDPRSGKQDRWRSLMIAALKQSRRSWLPLLAEPMTVNGVFQRHRMSWLGCHRWALLVGPGEIEAIVTRIRRISPRPMSPKGLQKGQTTDGGRFGSEDMGSQ